MASPAKQRNHNKENTCESPCKKNVGKDDSTKAFQINLVSAKSDQGRDSNRKDALSETFLQNLRPMIDVNTSFDEEVPQDESQEPERLALGSLNL